MKRWTAAFLAVLMLAGCAGALAQDSILPLKYSAHMISVLADNPNAVYTNVQLRAAITLILLKDYLIHVDENGDDCLVYDSYVGYLPEMGMYVVSVGRRSGGCILIYLMVNEGIALYTHSDQSAQEVFLPNADSQLPCWKNDPDALDEISRQLVEIFFPEG